MEEAEGVHLLTMEQGDGHSLDRLLPPYGFPIAELLRIAIPLVDALQEGARSLGIEARPAGRPYGSDASFLSTKGIVPVVFGPGDDRVAHALEESIDVAEVVTAAEVLAEAVCRLRLG